MIDECRFVLRVIHSCRVIEVANVLVKLVGFPLRNQPFNVGFDASRYVNIFIAKAISLQNDDLCVCVILIRKEFVATA